MKIIELLNAYIWNFPMLILLLGTHLFFTIRLKFVQKDVFKGIRYSISKDKSNPDGLSGFAALATTLAATLGTGNIIGVSTAIALGGPGAVLWCWLTGILGMATTYAECFLSSIYRVKSASGSYVGGPMYILEYGLNAKKLAIIYALCTLIASFGVGCTTQSNAISTTGESLWNWSPFIVGFCIAIPVGLVIIGGVQSIGKVCTKLVPAMGAFYLTGCLILLVMNHDYILSSIVLIGRSAFQPTAIAGGTIASSLQTAARFGIARGLFTNESGLGTAGIAAASANTANPKRQALISMTATFWDTVVMCAITGLVIVTNLEKNPTSIQNYSNGELTTAAFEALPYGTTLLGIAIIAFAVATLIGWSYFGEKATEYLFGSKGIPLYQLFYIVMIFIGAIMSLNLVWELTDLINAFMAIPCLIGILLLQNKVRVSHTHPSK